MNQTFTKKSSFFGAPSIALVLMATGLTIFSLLALKSSLNEQKMAKKAAEASKTYFELSGRLEETLCEIDEKCMGLAETELENAILSVPCVEEYKTVLTKMGTVERYIGLYVLSERNENMAFRATVRFYPEDGRYDVLEWKAERKSRDESSFD